MVLAYLWVKKHFSLEDQEFSFSRKYSIHRNDGKTSCIPDSLHIEECREYTDFYNVGAQRGIREISALIGQNGVGKTTLFRSIMMYLAPDMYAEAKLQNDYALDDLNTGRDEGPVFLAVFWDESNGSQQLKYYSATQHKVQSNSHSLALLSIDELKRFHIVYLNNYLDLADYERPQISNVTDLSVGNRMRKEMASAMNKNIEDGIERGLLTTYFYEDTLRMVKFIFSKDSHIDIITERDDSGTSLMETPYHLICYCTAYDSKPLGKWEVPQEINDVFTDMLSRVVHSKSLHTKFEMLMAYSVFCTSMRHILSVGDDEPKKAAASISKTGSRVLDMVSMILTNASGINRNSGDNDWLYSLIKNCYSGLEKAFKEQYLSINRNLPFRVDQILQPYKNMIAWLAKNSSKSLFDFSGIHDQVAPYFMVTVKSKDAFIEFCQHYSNTNEFFEYLRFKWPMSSGEYNYLSLFAKLYDAMPNKVKDKTQKLTYMRSMEGHDFHAKSILFLLDEPDLGLHPQWQQNMVRALCGYLPEVFTKYNDADIHVMMASHSPVVLSDIHNKSVVNAQKSDIQGCCEPKNFGQNIYLLYSDCYGVDHPIGYFAEDKIQETLDALDNLLGDDFTDNPSNEQANHILSKTLVKAGELAEITGEATSVMLLRNKIEAVRSKYRQGPTPELSYAVKAFRELTTEQKRQFINILTDNPAEAQDDTN